MYQDKLVLCGANSYEEKFYIDPVLIITASKMVKIIMYAVCT